MIWHTSRCHDGGFTIPSTWNPENGLQWTTTQRGIVLYQTTAKENKSLTICTIHEMYCNLSFRHMNSSMAKHIKRNLFFNKGGITTLLFINICFKYETFGNTSVMRLNSHFHPFFIFSIWLYVGYFAYWIPDPRHSHSLWSSPAFHAMIS